MTPNTALALAHLLHEEGGVGDAGDGKGITRYGQTADWLAEYGLVAPTSPENAQDNYVKVWALTRIADVIEWDVDVGKVMVTFATHAHERTAIKALQRVLGVTVDGSFGPNTSRALLAASPPLVLRNLVAEYSAHLGNALANRERDNRQFARDWLGTRLANLIRLIRVSDV